MMAFVSLAQTEPMIAGNHLRTAMARALAESGVELALWALRGPGAGGITPPATGATAAAPYDGSAVIPIGSRGGGADVAITGVSSTAASVRSAGWLPTTGTATAKAHRMIEAIVAVFPDLGLSVPCAVCVNGPLTVANRTTLDARPSFASECGGKYGAYSTGVTTIRRGGDVYGGDGGSTQDVSNKPGIDFVDNRSDFAFAFAFTDAQLAALRSFARASGSYARGAVTFDAANPLPAAGLVFVDTGDASSIGAGTPDATARIPVVVLSNLGQDSDVRQALENGAVAYLVKSNVSLQDLVRKVRAVLDDAADGVSGR